MTAQLVHDLEDVQALPKGELYRLTPSIFYTHGFAPSGWEKVEFSDEDVRWAHKLYARRGTPQTFSTQSELLLHIIRKHRFLANWRGYPSVIHGLHRSERYEIRYRLDAPKPPVPPKGPSGISSPSRKSCGGGCVCSGQ